MAKQPFLCPNKSAFPLSISSTLVEVGKWLGHNKERKQDIELSGRVCITQTSGQPLLTVYSAELCDTDVHSPDHKGDENIIKKSSWIYVNVPF